MKKFRNENKGFTLAELLIVVAIIAVLAAISIPILASRLEGAKEATDIANLRAAYSAAQTAVMTGSYSKSGAAVALGTGNSTVYYYNSDGDLDPSEGAAAKAIKGQGSSTKGGNSLSLGTIEYKEDTVAKNKPLKVTIGYSADTGIWTVTSIKFDD